MSPQRLQQRLTLQSIRGLLLVPSVLAAAALLAACGQKSEGGAHAGGGAPPPAEVGVVTVKLGEVDLVTELPGRLEASRVAEVRARAAGILQKRVFTEGSDVKAGQLLFTIDPAPYAATYQSAQASLARAQANLQQAAALAERYKPLVAANAISKQDYVNAVAAAAQADADVAVGKAAVQTAKINLDYSQVTAPISGRIGRALVTEGALVGQGEATALAVVQQINPMYVNFTQSAAEVMALRRGLETGQLKRAPGTEAASVRLVLDGQGEYAQAGRLLFSDLTVDSTTGQITLRAEIPNPKGQLLPGLYVRVRLEQSQAANAFPVPQQAVTRSNTGDSVMIVGADGKVAPRKVKVSSAKGANWVVVDGLKDGDQIMVDGFQKLRGDAPVKPVPWQPIDVSASAAGGATPAAKAPAASAASAAASK